MRIQLEVVICIVAVEAVKFNSFEPPAESPRLWFDLPNGKTKSRR
jgi:hypothetical protein